MLCFASDTDRSLRVLFWDGSGEMSEQALVHVPSSSHQGSGHQTALHRSAMVGNSDAIAALIKGGCAVDLRDHDGNTALHEVSWHGFSQCVKLLVKAGADVQIRNKAGNTALHLACQNAHAQTARLLLLGGSSPDTKNNMGDTCLHVAARYNNGRLVKILLKTLCSMTEINQGGDTALHVAAALNHKKTVQLLLEAGADGKIKNKAGKTALDKARDNNHKELALLLARAPQVHRFLRGRTIVKRRQRLVAEHRTQSAPRGETQPHKEDSSSAEEETPDGQQIENGSGMRVSSHQHHHHHHHQLQPLYHKTSATCRYSHSRGRRVKEQILNEGFSKSKSGFHTVRDLLCDDEESSSMQNGKTYQLYTLYRDQEGRIKQAPASGCHCGPVLKKLEEQVKATQGEMRLHILNVQEQVNSRLDKMDRRNRHQIKVFDILNQERVAEERRNMLYRMDQKVAQAKEEALMTQQAAVRHELKKWCVSQVKDGNVHVAAEAQYYKLLPSPSVERSVAEAELESLPLLSVLSGDSSTSLATYVNVLPSKSNHSLRGLEQEQSGSRTYFEMKVDRSPDDYENASMFPLPANHSSELLLGSADTAWQAPGAQGDPLAAVVPLGEEGFSSSSSQSNISGPQRIPPHARSASTRRRRHFREVMMGGCRRTGIRADGTATLEFFIDRPSEPTFSQERSNLHAVEVTQRFFETVSTQLECWCQRKILEVEQQTEVRAQQDRKELLQRIGTLEEELQRLRTNEGVETLCAGND